METTKIEKILRLMRLMSGSTSFSIEELAEKMDTTPRTVYRYIDTLKDSGFVVEKVRGNVYRILKMPSQLKNLDKLVYFSEEEACLLCNLIEGLDTTNTLKAGLGKKLSAIYDLTSLNNYIVRKENSINVQTLGEAIREKKTVVLKKYASANSGNIRDRIVEPFAFTTNYIDVWAYDVDDRKNKLFKIARIDSVELKDEWKFEDKHQQGYLDIFRMCSFNQTHVRLELSLRAKNLLCEEFPLAPTALQNEDGKWILDTMVSDIRGVGRFVIGLAGDVQVIDSPELEDYIKDFAREHFGV